ncbi:Paired amphipathic helix protein Sin3a [Nosema bombycis CQ1]|uniref:Paired amphipathic helix protein Sin3a n=1 Tax=Nosema bombycis (strain CQ1 / CVCC 102059) TaxID=578461 RepID=R0MMY4_NOSB1|nr:Paired amphipathic helix protein Sin3a [Nosema bombycis CQ1]|eukprot:EOB14233.1 Paired amphipathic helix protein Sin3a [Nosema bombycis CQ1]
MHHQQPPQFRRNVYNSNQKMMHGGHIPHPMMHKIGPPPPHIHQPHLPGSIPPGMVPNFPPQQNLKPQHMQSPIRHPPQGPQKPQFNYQAHPPNPQHDEVERLKRKQANNYIQKVKKRYANHPSVYKTFVELLQNYQTTADFEKIHASIKGLLWENPDLIIEFEKDFASPSAVKSDVDMSFYKKISEVLVDKDTLNDFFRCLNYYNQHLISQKDFLLMVEPLLKSTELINQFKKYIKYNESPDELESKNQEKCKKIGSYKILNQEIVNEYQDPIAREVINTSCVNCPTFESEDANFVFIKRNHYEDSLFKVEEERYDASLIIERIDFLIMSLEIVYSSLTESELNIRDLGMSPGIIKEVFRSIYDESASEVLEGILTNAKTAIPIVIKRLYSVNRQFREKLRIKNKIWNDSVERVYFKALDTFGGTFRSNDKMIVSPKNLGMEFETGIQVDISDVECMKDLVILFNAYIKTNQNDNKKANIPGLFEAVDLIFEIITKQDSEFTTNFDVFCVFRLLTHMYERLKEMKDLKLPPLESSKLAVELNLTEEFKYENRYEELKNFIRDFLEKNIDSPTFEEKIRIMSNCKGYKLFGIRKIFSKIEKMIIGVVEDRDALKSLEKQTVDFEISEGCILKFKEGIFEVSNSEPVPSDIDTSKVFLSKNIKQESFCGAMINDLKFGTKEGSEEIKPLENSELFYLSVDSTILKKE